MEGIFPDPAPSPVVLGTLTLEMAAVASTRAEISNSIDFLAAARLRRARCAMRLAR